jgi:hypothetical protein
VLAFLPPSVRSTLVFETVGALLPVGSSRVQLTVGARRRGP